MLQSMESKIILSAHDGRGEKLLDKKRYNKNQTITKEIRLRFVRFCTFVWSILLVKTLAEPACDWKTFDKNQANLTITNCSATTIDGSFLGTHNKIVDKNNVLIELNLQTGLTIIEEFTFNTASNMVTLNLFKNNINIISEKAFSGLENLQELRLTYNKITHLHKNTFFELTKLKYLYIYNNQLTDFDFACLQNNLNLVTIDLEANALTSFETSSPFRLNNMFAFYLNKNLLTKLPLENFPELPHLNRFYIESNRLSRVDVDNIKLRFPSLKTMKFGSNRWDCFYLIEMIENIKSHFPGIQIDDELSGDVLDPSFEHLSNCLTCPSLNDNQSQIVVLERQYNKSLEEIKQYKTAAVDGCNSSSSNIVIMLILIFCMLIILVLVLYFYPLRKTVYVAKEAEEPLDGNNYMEMLCN